jgi:two-component system sensor histidine kinase UhpB
VTNDTVRNRPLFRRVFATNAAILVAMSAVTVLVFSPGAISRPVAYKELAILAGALAVMLVLNFLIVRRATAPLYRLMELMHRADPLRPGERVPVESGASEATELAATFNEMLDRLEHERHESARRAIAAQESERVRIARELHDEIGQGLTAGILQLSGLRKRAPAELQDEVGAAQETVRDNLDELRRIAQRLRPETLDELGLVSALTSISQRLEQQSGVRIERDLARELPDLEYEEELVIYRVAQEALTNVVRHARASSVALSLSANGVVALRVADDGAGIDGAAPPGGGIRGMYERALLIGATLRVEERSGGGTEVELRLRTGESGR